MGFPNSWLLSNVLLDGVAAVFVGPSERRAAQTVKLKLPFFDMLN